MIMGRCLSSSRARISLLDSPRFSASAGDVCRCAGAETTAARDGGRLRLEERNSFFSNEKAGLRSDPGLGDAGRKRGLGP